MVQQVQNYLNNLINKNKIFYLDLSSQCQVSTCEKCNKKSWAENSSQLNGEIEDLKEFTNLRGINASNNKFSSLEGLFSLPNKNKLEKINLFGNQIKEVDLARLFTEFPNLKYLNLERNPLVAKNLENLSSEQLNKLAEGMKSKKIRISLNQGSILTDLLDYTQKLIKKGNNTQQAQQLQAAIQGKNSIHPNKENNNSKLAPYLIVGGLVLTMGLILAIGYYWGKRKKEQEEVY